MKYIFGFIFLLSCRSNNTELKDIPKRIDRQTNGTDSSKNISIVDSNRKKMSARFDTTEEKPDSIEMKVYELIESLPEVKKISKYIDSISNHDHGVSLIIRSKPSKNEPYYWVQAGNNLKFRFEPYFNFYVYGDNYEIKYLDVNNEDKVLSLKEWRKKRLNIK